MNVGQFLVASARSYPDRPAISFGETLVWTYRGFGERVARLAGGLRALPGVAPGDRVALTMKNCPEYLEAMYATWHAGLCTLPINSKLHPREFAYILENCGARVCFATDDLHDQLAPLVNEIAGLERVIRVAGPDWEALAGHELIGLQPARSDDPAWLFYTSGTTGKPKGATLTHRSLAAMTWRYYADIDQVVPTDCMLHAAPLSHASGLYALPHTAKASHHVIPASQGFDPAEVFGLSHAYSDITMFAAPTMVMRMTDHPKMGAARVASFKTIFYGGAPMYLEDLKRALAAFGPCLWQGYGQGEMPNTITHVPKAMHAETGHPRFEERLATVGIPRTGVEVRIVDADGCDLPPGEIGEVAARSDVGMIGYWNNPQATAQALRDGWLFTGDLGVVDQEGFLTLKDRSKDVIISGGTNIYPREVEEALLLHPSVQEVSVVGRRHPDWGEEIVACVVAKPGAVVSEAELDEVCLDNIARFKRPKLYRFLDALPKNNYGKVLKTELRDMVASLREPQSPA